MACLQTKEFTGKVSTDQTGRFPVTASRGSKYLMVLYDHDSNAILAKPLTSRNEHELILFNRVLHAYLSDRGLTPQYPCNFGLLVLQRWCDEGMGARVET